jgi:hypothetical protein
VQTGSGSSLSAQVAELKPKAAHVAREWEASLTLVKQFKASLIEVGAECPESASMDDIEALT